MAVSIGASREVTTGGITAETIGAMLVRIGRIDSTSEMIGAIGRFVRIGAIGRFVRIGRIDSTSEMIGLIGRILVGMTFVGRILGGTVLVVEVVTGVVYPEVTSEETGSDVVE